MISRQRIRKGTSFARLFLVAAMLLQLLLFPIHTAHATGTGEAVINEVEIVWGDMLFEYVTDGENGGWRPASENGNRITVTNRNDDAAMRATFRYTSDPSTAGIANVVATLFVDSPAEGVSYYPVQNLGVHAAEVEAFPYEALNPDQNTFSAYLELTGAPTEELNNAALGTITITISKPMTNVTTWGHQHNDDVHLYWVIQLIGCANSRIPGSTLTSELLPSNGLSGMADHMHTVADYSITVGASQMDASGREVAWYSWTVPGDSPDLQWVAIENGEGQGEPQLAWHTWSYTFPETVPGTEIALGNKGWTYFIDYTSTMIQEDVAGIYGHMNRITLDEDPYTVDEIPPVEGWLGVEHHETHGNIVPFGERVQGSDGEIYFNWEINAIVPGLQNDEKADYFWYIMDYLEVFQGYNRVDYVENDLGEKHADQIDPPEGVELTSVRASYVTTNDVEKNVDVPHIDYAGAEDDFAWHDHWSATDMTGTTYGKHIDLLTRCYCTEETCPFWTNGACGSKYHSDPSQTFCQCWTAPEAVTITFSYRTPISFINDRYIDNQLNQYNLVNRAELWRSAEQTNGMWEGIMVDILDVSLPITRDPIEPSEEP